MKTPSIRDVIGRYITLKPSPDRWEARCPFHKDRGHSLLVDVTLGSWRCEECGIGGSADEFVARYENPAK